MKRVLVVTESNSVWGAERSLLQLAEHAESNRVRLHFLIAKDSPLGDSLAELGLSYDYHEFAAHPALEASGSLSDAGVSQIIREFASVVTGARRISRLLRGFDSVLVFSIWQAPETILGSWLARVPVDVDFHETFNNSRAMKLLGLIAKASRRVIVPSAVLAERSGLSASRRVAVLPRPVDLDGQTVERKAWQPSEPMTIGVFGQIQPHKNVLEIAQAVSSVNDGIRLLVVGGAVNESVRTDYETEVRRFVASMANESAVVNFVPNVKQLMGECDVVVNASEHEAFGRTIVEAVAMGCYPVAVGDWGPTETVHALGVGSVLERIDELPQLVTQLRGIHRSGPVLDRAPETLRSYAASNVARDYFALLTSGMTR